MHREVLHRGRAVTELPCSVVSPADHCSGRLERASVCSTTRYVSDVCEGSKVIVGVEHGGGIGPHIGPRVTGGRPITDLANDIIAPALHGCVRQTCTGMDRPDRDLAHPAQRTRRIQFHRGRDRKVRLAAITPALHGCVRQTCTGEGASRFNLGHSRGNGREGDGMIVGSAIAERVAVTVTPALEAASAGHATHVDHVGARHTFRSGAHHATVGDAYRKEPGRDHGRRGEGTGGTQHGLTREDCCKRNDK